MSYLIGLKSNFENVSRGLDTVTKWICVILVFLMTVEVLTAVFFRYVLNAPIKWGEELARFIMVWAGLLGISIALKDGEHIGLEMLTGKLSGRPLYLVKLIINLMIFIFLLVLFIWGIEICRQAWDSFMPGLQISWTWSHLAVPVTAAIQLIHVFAWLLEQTAGVVRPEQG
ncbi:MAG: TRAP transporter small permease [Desulfobacterales bacterium]|nr:MAG: TRAP transporter small permease [Desulfobacterales bacterium]